VRSELQGLAEQARDRFGDRLAGKPGRRLANDLVRIDDALDRLPMESDKGSRRAEKALSKASKRVTGLGDASLKKVHRKLKKARKAVLKAV